MLATCRFCRSIIPRGGIKYSVRHSAHESCFVERRGVQGLRDLHLWQLEAFPALLAKRLGVFETIMELIAEHPEQEERRRVEARHAAAEKAAT